MAHGGIGWVKVVIAIFLMLFVLVDGWQLIIGSLAESFFV